MASRTRPRRSDPDVSALRAIRRATRDYLTVLESALAALTDDAIAGQPHLAYLRSSLALATGKRGGSSFGTPIQLLGQLDRMLGEAEGETT